MKSLDFLQKRYNLPLEIGSRVLVIPQSTAQSLKMRVGIVSADITTNEKIEIMYDDEVHSLSLTYSLTHSSSLSLTHSLTYSLIRAQRTKNSVILRM